MKHALLAALLVACGTQAAPPAAPAVAPKSPQKVGDKAPPLSVQNATHPSGPPVALTAGAPSLVWFFATWSGPDKQAMPKIGEIQRRFESLRVIAVSVDDEARGVAEFAATYNGGTFDAGWDEGHRATEAWRPSYEPTFYLIDAKGIIRNIYAGYHDGQAEEMSHDIQQLLMR
jgi:thiol-disulfide isomerase/thioredoxin